MSRPQRIRFFEPTKRGSRFRVRWRIQGTAGHEKTFQRKVEAKRFLKGLEDAYEDGDRFDVRTGLPASWNKGAGTSVAEFARQWYLQRWPGKAAKTRSSDAEMLVDVVAATLLREAPDDADVRRWVRTVVCARPTAADNAEATDPAEDASLDRAAVHVERWSPRGGEIGADEARVLWAQLGRRLDGAPSAASTATRRRTLARRFFDDAVREGKLTSNPLREVALASRVPSGEVDPSQLPSPDEARELIRLIGMSGDYGKRARTYLLTLLLSGCRPSEAVNLQSSDLRPIDDGWVELSFRGARPQAGSRFTDDADAFDTREVLKWRREGHVRRVPVPPELHQAIREHLDEFGEGPSGLLFATASGRPISGDLSRHWRAAVRGLWPSPHPYSRLRPYDLRHIHATALIEAGVSAPRIATRLGHSVPELLKTYAGVFNRDEAAERDLIQGALA
jgi:integrase